MHIENEDLILDKIPTEDAEWWKILKFAQHTFNGFQVHGSVGKCGEVATKVIEKKTESLTDLRTCLFFLVRQSRFTGEDSHESTERELVRRIRENVSRGNFA
jgi:hypothetical protein